jgi:hypothetical protein
VISDLLVTQSQSRLGLDIGTGYLSPLRDFRLDAGAFDRRMLAAFAAGSVMSSLRMRSKSQACITYIRQAVGERRAPCRQDERPVCASEAYFCRRYAIIASRCWRARGPKENPAKRTI